jgi:hypothetical protein
VRSEINLHLCRSRSAVAPLERLKILQQVCVIIATLGYKLDSFGYVLFTCMRRFKVLLELSWQTTTCKKLMGHETKRGEKTRGCVVWMAVRSLKMSVRLRDFLFDGRSS